jgi:disulfide bond formation protein DsbB
MINSKNIFFLAVLFSIFAILSAFFMQYVLGHAPCKLCTYQRIPYYIIILVGLITLFFPKIIKLTSFLLIFLLLAEFLVSNYHTLSTYEVISYSGCQSAEIPNDINQLKEALMSDTLIVNCSNANLKYFGIPLSIYNSFFSLMFLIVIVFNAYKEKNQKAETSR